MKGERHFFEDCARVGDELWFSASKENALCRKNIRTGELDIVYQFEEPCHALCLHSRVFFDRGILYFVPANAGALAAYELASGKCRYFEIPRLRVYGIKEGAPYYRFESAVQIGRRLYMISLLSPEIMVFHMDTEALETVYIKELDFQNGAYHHTFGTDGAVWDTKLYLAVYKTAKLLELDTQKHTYRILEYPKSTAAFCCIAQDGDLFYIADQANADLIRYRAQIGQFDTMCRRCTGPDTGGTFCKCIFRDEKLYLFRNYSDYFYIYDILLGRCTAVRAGICPPEDAPLFCEERMESKYYAFWQTKNGIFFYYAPSDTMYRLDAAGELFEIPFFGVHDKQALSMQRLQKYAGKNFFWESQTQDLDLFLDCLSQSGKDPALKRQETVGERIHREIRKGI